MGSGEYQCFFRWYAGERESNAAICAALDANRESRDGVSLLNRRFPFPANLSVCSLSIAEGLFFMAGDQGIHELC